MSAFEERRLARAHAALSIDARRADRIARAMIHGQAQALGAQLWQDSCRAAQAALDDRTLYWLRLAVLQRARESGVPEDTLEAFEMASRGRDFHFDDSVDRRVVVSGFDPFNLDADIEQTNPSGALALVLHDRIANVGGRRVQFKTTVVPVRFADFDAGYVEGLFGPVLRTQGCDLLVTVSMGREGFDLERFPGRRRSSRTRDNDGVLIGASERNPLVPGDRGQPLAGPEFLEFSLTGPTMQQTPGRYAVNVNCRVQTAAKGTFDAHTLADLDGQIAVSGSGGGFLSNEISYRTLLLAQADACQIPIGHIHTPRIDGFDAESTGHIVAQAQRLIESAVPSPRSASVR